MKKSIIWLMPFLISGLFISGCSPKMRYEKRLKHELASGERYDSLFMGLYLGMSEKDFYTHCWKLNRTGVIKQGPSNLSVEYNMQKELNFPATMNFYPNFAKEKIVEMPVQFKYNGWAPWNKELTSDKLQTDVLRWYKKVYGGGFIKVKHPNRGIAYVKLNGNRRITIFVQDELHVWAVFTDLLADKALNDSTAAPGAFEDITKGLK